MLRRLLPALLLAPALHAGTIRIDFGKNDGIDGTATSSPDARGHHWNNFTPASPIASGSTAENLVTTENAPTGIGLTVTSGGWMSNGIRNGGLLDPSVDLLGELAVGTATEDYFFLQGTSAAGNLKLTGLDPGRLYELRLFGTRATDEIRRTSYRVTAGNGVFRETLQTSGPGTGGDSYNGNDRTVVSFPAVQPDAAGEIRLQAAVAAGGFAYLGVLEIVEGEEAPPVAPVTPARVRIDFGRDDGANGNPTSSPDGFGHHWNNFPAGFDVTSGSSPGGLVTTAGDATSLGVLVSSGGWKANGIQNGGLLAPNDALLGDFAVATATQDYFFVEGASGTGTLRITGLRPDRLYDFRLFGTRETAELRRSRYTITAAGGTFTDTLQTSGAAIGAGGYNGNNNTVIHLDGIQADTSGEASLQLAVAAGNFAYLGALEIIEGPAVAKILAPPPASIAKWVEQDALDPIEPGAVLFVGSSSIRRWEALAEDFSDYRIIQRGFGGSQLAELNSVAHHIVLPYRPAAIVMWEGTNDLRSGKSAAQVFADFQTFLGIIRPELGDVPVLYLGVTPTPDSAAIEERRKELNAQIAAYAETDPTVHYVDLPAFFEALEPAAFASMYIDGLHLGTAGYAEWTRIVRPALEAALAPNKEPEENPAAPGPGERIFFDFGPSAALDGGPTASPDANGNHWNHWYPLDGGAGINSGERVTGLVTASGADTGIRLTITGGFIVNGKRNGGLMAPDGPSPALLGDLGRESATQDYFFSTADDQVGGGDDDVPGGFMLDGLDPALEYEFRLFGSRNTADTRITRYTVSGAQRQTLDLQTSGTGIGSNGSFAGNDDEVAVISGVRPDRFGQVFLGLLALQGNFAYLNSMEIGVSEPAAESGIVPWRTLHFSSAELDDPALESSLWGLAADPDGDGLPNLVEYALGGDPRSRDEDRPAAQLDAGEFTFTFPRSTTANGVVVGVETSTDLVGWSPVEDVPVSSDGQVELRRAVVPVEVDPRRWLRLKVALDEN